MEYLSSVTLRRDFSFVTSQKDLGGKKLKVRLMIAPSILRLKFKTKAYLSPFCPKCFSTIWIAMNLAGNTSTIGVSNLLVITS